MFIQMGDRILELISEVSMVEVVDQKYDGSLIYCNFFVCWGFLLLLILVYLYLPVYCQAMHVDISNNCSCFHIINRSDRFREYKIGE